MEKDAQFGALTPDHALHSRWLLAVTRADEFFKKKEFRCNLYSIFVGQKMVVVMEKITFASFCKY